MDVMPHFSATLKALMKERGVTARTLSKATGIPTSTLSEWCAGRDPKLSDPVVKLARFFGVTLEYLATGERQEEKTLKGFFESLDDGFVAIHQGIYRVKVEKCTKKEPNDV